MPQLYAYLLPLTLLLACKKDQAEFDLSPVTQTGANTLSCLVDGRVYLAYGRRCTDFGSNCREALRVQYNLKRGRLAVSSVLVAKGRDEGLDITCDSAFVPGVVAGVQHPFAYRSAGLGYTNDRLNYATADRTRTQITITRLDKVRHIVSGTFKGYLKNLLINPTTEKLTVLVTDGRFDAVYSNLVN
jgi:hypothetical protein